MKKFKLTNNNIADFILKKARLKLPFEFTEIKKRDEVSEWSNSNYLWRLVLKTKTGERTLYVKQAQEYNRRSVERGKPVAVDPKRICGEYQLITFLREIWGRGYVPEIYYFDPRSCVTVMSDVSRGAKLLVEELEKDRLHPELGKIFGSLFGKLHSQTYGSRFECCGSQSWQKQLDQFFQQHIGLGIRKLVSDKAVDVFFQEVHASTYSWTWGDAVHRNIFVRAKPRRGETNVSMVDFDHAARYDPAVDCGMLLAHWYWMGLKNEELKAQSKKFIKDFWVAYEREFLNKVPPLRIRGGEGELRNDIKGIKKRANRWIGLYLVSRTDGKGGSYFAKWPEWEKKIREEGIELFLGK